MRNTKENRDLRFNDLDTNLVQIMSDPYHIVCSFIDQSFLKTMQNSREAVQELVNTSCACVETDRKKPSAQPGTDTEKYEKAT